MTKLEKGDYYYEDGLLVFTAQFHLKRGRCCRLGCRHCPWESAAQECQGPPRAPAADLALPTQLVVPPVA